MSKIHYEEFIQAQIDLINSQAALTEIQKKIFNHLLKNQLLDEGIAMELGMSRASFYRQKKILQNKISKVLKIYWYNFDTFLKLQKKGLAPKSKAEIKSQISTKVEIMYES